MVTGSSIDLGHDNVFHPLVKIIQGDDAGGIHIGSGNIFEEGVVIMNNRSDVIIGDNNVFHTGCEYYTEAVTEAYQQVDAECVLSAPVFGDGMKVAGLIEVINKQIGNPFFNAEDEFMIKALASLGTLLFNHANVKQSAIKKTDDIKMFLNTASMMTTEKTDMGDLLHVIMQTTRELVSAERCALFMLDRDREELWSTVAQGSAEIRIPMNKGIAGHVAMTGETLNIPDAYADSRFNREVDMRTGYRTRNILCMPMYDQQHEIIGVTQVINKLPEQIPFTKEDEMQLASFSSLAASTIDKQLAFKNLHSHLAEMTHSRAYMTLICFELGLSEYRARNWQAAIMHFKKAIALSDDKPSRTFIERCRGLIDGKFEVSEEWDGVWREMI
eukprot:jgi/Hompol1/3464/HPOL_005231-RA